MEPRLSYVRGRVHIMGDLDIDYLDFTTIQNVYKD